MNHPKNKLAKSGLFATPESFKDLEDYCHRFTGSERVVALTVLGMTLNWASTYFDEVLNALCPEK